MPPRIPLFAVGMTILRMLEKLVLPKAVAAEIKSLSTRPMTSRLTEVIIGMIITAIVHAAMKGAPSALLNSFLKNGMNESELESEADQVAATGESTKIPQIPTTTEGKAANKSISEVATRETLGGAMNSMKNATAIDAGTAIIKPKIDTTIVPTSIGQI
jgi:hypothetical protein